VGRVDSTEAQLRVNTCRLSDSESRDSSKEGINSGQYSCKQFDYLLGFEGLKCNKHVH
jgi:hypothetical protein